MMVSRNILMAAAAVAMIAIQGWSSQASAITVTIAENLTLIQSPPGTSQPATGLCVIGEPSASCGVNLPTAGSPTEYLDIFSPDYTVQSITNAVGGNDFSMGIDINNAPGAATDHSLDVFIMEHSTDGGATWQQVFAWDTPTPLPVINSGTGESDWQLDGFSLALLAATDLVRFGLDMTGVSGGREQFFTLFAPSTVIPLPAALPLLGGGLGLLGLLGWRRRKTAVA